MISDRIPLIFAINKMKKFDHIEPVVLLPTCILFASDFIDKPLYLYANFM